jgi:hypothetical protein
VDECARCGDRRRAAETAPTRARAAHAEDLEDRRVAALAALKELGNPGLRPRRVPGRYHLSLVARVLGRVGEDRPVDVEPAWPIGRLTWKRPWQHGQEDVQTLDSGYTPSERIVPMEHATEGDRVERLYSRWTLDIGRAYRSDARVIELTAIVTALEAALAQHRR